MNLPDQSAEYYLLREDLERALAVAASCYERRRAHLRTARIYAELAREAASLRRCR